jgi:flagellar biogenesis protein FliO
MTSPIVKMPDLTVPIIFNVLEFLLIACCIVSFVIVFFFNTEQRILIYTITALIILIFLILLIRRFSNTYVKSTKQLDNQRKAQLYSCLFGDSEKDESINIIRSRAIQYCQELIDDYKDTRRNARSTYYIFQISTIVLSGVTPILVILDKTDVNAPWIRWLPVIFPAIASIVTSISTSFPFQKNWVNANTAVELLEAEQEKFILGVTLPYRFYDLPDEAQRKQKVQESVENFITQVNTIHLKQFQGSNQTDTKQSEGEVMKAEATS